MRGAGARTLMVLLGALMLAAPIAGRATDSALSTAADAGVATATSAAGADAICPDCEVVAPTERVMLL